MLSVPCVQYTLLIAHYKHSYNLRKSGTILEDCDVFLSIKGPIRARQSIIISQ